MFFKKTFLIVRSLELDSKSLNNVEKQVIDMDGTIDKVAQSKSSVKVAETKQVVTGLLKVREEQSSKITNKNVTGT